MQPVEVAVPQDSESVGIIVVGKVGNKERQIVRKFTFRDAHFPIDVIVFLVVIPFESDMVELHKFY